MPYFNWQGITLQGTLRKGTTFARSPEVLDNILFKKDIALLRATTAIAPFFKRTISKKRIIDFFKHIAMLLKAGVLLPDALTIVNEQIDCPATQEMIEGLAASIHAGIPLSKAMQNYPKIFDSLMIHMVYVGQEAGTLASALHTLSVHMEMTHTFKKQLRTAALMPCITLAFFFVIAAVIVIGIIPRFEAMFASFGQQLPPITYFLVGMSSSIRAWYINIGIGSVLLVILLHRYSRSRRSQKIKKWFFTHMPYVNTLIKESSIMYFMRSMGVLLGQGIAVPVALKIANQAISFVVLQEHSEYLEQEVASGATLSDAMAQHPAELFSQDVIVMIKVGEQAGTIAKMFERVADNYQEKIQGSLLIITKLFQPLLMVILGLLITILIFAIYLPIIQCSQFMY